MRAKPLILAGCTLCLAAPAMATETITYSYDVHGRLVRVARTGTVNNNVTTTYTFDKVDNRTSKAT